MFFGLRLKAIARNIRITLTTCNRDCDCVSAIAISYVPITLDDW